MKKSEMFMHYNPHANMMLRHEWGLNFLDFFIERRWLNDAIKAYLDIKLNTKSTNTQ